MIPEPVGVSVAITSDGTRFAAGDPASSGMYRNIGEVQIIDRSLRTMDALHWILTQQDVRYGIAVGISDDGRAAVVGVERNTPELWTEAGSWTRADLVLDAKGYDEELSRAVAISGDGRTAAIAARCNASGNRDPRDTSMPCAGAVYVFQR